MLVGSEGLRSWERRWKQQLLNGVFATQLAPFRPNLLKFSYYYCCCYCYCYYHYYYYYYYYYLYIFIVRVLNLRNLRTSWYQLHSLAKSFLNVQSAPTTTGTTLIFTFHILLISISKSLYLLIFSASLSAMFLSSGTEASISIQVLDFRSWMTTSGLLAKIFLSVIIE